MALVSVILVASCFSADKISNDNTGGQTVAEKIVNTIVIVEESSGVVVHIKNNRALVLTAAHNIEEFKCPECFNKIKVSILEQVITPDHMFFRYKKFKVLGFEENIKSDLALLEIESDFPLYDLQPVQVIRRKLRLGEDIYTVSNPQLIYRSLKKGIVGSIDRIVRGFSAIEISGGIVYGSSGGGVFTMEGELVGIILAVRILDSDFCYEVYDEEDKLVGEECMQIPLPYLGFASTPDTIREFLLKGKFKENFKYLGVK